MKMLYAILKSCPRLAIMPAPEENHAPSPQHDAQTDDAEVIDAEIVDDGGGDNSLAANEVAANEVAADVVIAEAAALDCQTAVDLNVQRLSSKGGAVGSVVLSLFGLAGLAISWYSVVNVLLALLFALWGLQSPLRSLAKVGLLLGILGLIVFLATIR